MPTLQELLQQQAALEHEIARARDEGRTRAIAQIRTIMAENGLSPSDLAANAQRSGDGREGVRRPVAPKYRDPVTGNTWSGRGLRPKWLAAALASGKSLDNFAL